MTEATLYERLGVGWKIREFAIDTIATGRRVLRLLCAATAVVVVLVAMPTAAEEKSEEKSLFDRLGGVYPIAATVDDMVDRIYVNGTLNANPTVKAIHDRQGQAGFKFMVTAWVVQKAGGPKIYTGLPLDKAHAHLNITDREFDVVLNEAATTFYKFNVPKTEMDDLMALLERYRSQVVTSK